ncbi:MAG TPA: MFS transporter [Thermomicrobiales bacterium]|nr:MFS transporter [Thermomicrobiales bacterium]
MHQRLGAYAVYLIYSAAFALFASVTWTVNLVYQVDRVGLSPFQIVLIGTALELSYFLFEVPTGIVADVYSRRLSVIIGTFMLGAGFVLMGAVPEFGVMLLSQVICGIGYTLLSGAQEAWIADEIGEERARPAFLRGSQAATVGTITGIPIAIGLGSLDLALPIIVGGAGIVVLGGFLLLAMQETGFHGAAREDFTGWQSMTNTFHAGTRMIRSRPVLLTIIGIAVVFGSFNEGFDRLSVPHLLENFSFPAIGGFSDVVWVGGIRFVVELLGIVVLEVVRRRVDLGSHRAVSGTLFAINGGLVVSVLVFGLAGSSALAIVMMIVASLFRRSIYPLETVWVNQSLDPKVRATVISMTSQGDSFGQIFGGPAVGAVGSLFGLRAAIVTAGGLLTPILLLYARALGQGSEAVITVDDAAIVAE